MVARTGVPRLKVRGAYRMDRLGVAAFIPTSPRSGAVGLGDFPLGNRLNTRKFFSVNSVPLCGELPSTFTAAAGQWSWPEGGGLGRRRSERSPRGSPQIHASPQRDRAPR